MDVDGQVLAAIGTRGRDRTAYAAVEAAWGETVIIPRCDAMVDGWMDGWMGKDKCLPTLP